MDQVPKMDAVSEARDFGDCRLELPAIVHQCWENLSLAAETTDHPWRLPAISTVDSGAPVVRTVVLRAVNPEQRELVFHTDARSSKCRQIQTQPRICWMVYDQDYGVQLQATGLATIHTSGPLADEQWARAPLSSRRCYLGPESPGVSASGPTVNLPDDVVGRIPEEPRLREGRQHFATVVTRVDRLEWLLLRPDGNLRAVFHRSGGWQGEWLVP